MAGAILRIGTAKIRLATCVPHEVHYLLIFKAFGSLLKSDSTVNSDHHKYFLRFPMVHLTAAAYTTNLCLEFSSGNTIDLEMKEIGRR